MTSDLILNELHSNNNNTFGEDFDHSMIIDQRSQQLNDSTLIVANNSSNNNSICDVISREDATTDCSHLSSTPLSPVNSSPNSSQHVLSPSKHESHPFNVQNNGININDDSNSCKSNVTNVISVLNDFSRCDTTTTTSSDIRQTLLQTNIESNQTTNQSLTANHKRVYLDDQTLMSLSVNDYRQHWKQQELYINSIETQLKQFNRDNCDLISLRESEEKLKQQQLEANRRENILVMRLTTKEQEMQEYLNQIQELKQSQVPSNAQLQSTLVDPAVNLMFEKMKKEVELSRIKVEEMQNELKAWKFTPDSNTGKRLMAKCRLLYQENEELGKMIASGRIGKLEGELALQKNFSEEMKKSQAELDDFLLELDEDVEGMQSTIYYLQQQLKEAKEKLAKFEKVAVIFI